MKKNFGNKLVMAPLPVLIVATYDEEGVPNAMNVAWGGQCADNCIALNLSTSHKTTANIRINKAFTVCIADRAHLDIADYFGIVSGRDEDKITKTGVNVENSLYVSAPIFIDFPLTFECRLLSIEEGLEQVRVVGEVINMQADDSILDERGKVDFGKLQVLSFDPSSNKYRLLGDVVGNAFKDGAKIKNK